MEKEINIETVKERSVRGIVVLTGRTFFLQIIAFVSQLILFAYLDISDFGVFAVVSAIVNFLTYFSDIGLAAALIQKKEEPDLKDYRTTFTIQQILVLILILVVFLNSSLVISHYSLTTSGQYLMYALLISLFLSSLKSIPSVMLERRLEFTKLVLPQIIEQVIYNVILVILAVKGFGITSFTYAVLVRSVVGLVLIYIIQPWLVGFSFSLKSIKELFRFGVPYQLNTFLATLKDDGMIIVLGGILGPSGMGILSFAQKIGRYPLTFFMDTVTKVTFPTFSRLQDQKNELEKTVTRSIFFICLFVFPALAGLVILFPLITEAIPRYQKWAVALIPLILVSINYAFAGATTQLTNLLNAIGKIKITFMFMIMWTALTWLLVPFLARVNGVNGAALAYTLIGVSSIFVIFVVKKYVNFSITSSILRPLLGTTVMAMVLLSIRSFLGTEIGSLVLLTIIGFVTYLVSMVTIIGISLIEDAKKSFKIIFNR